MPERSKEHGAAAWLLQVSETSPFYCIGQCDTSGTTREVNAYRSELQGIHAILLALTVLCKAHGITSGKVTLACDNEQAVRHSNDKRLEVPSKVHHADLVRAIRRLKQDLPIEVVMQDVDGHKDKHVAFAELSAHEQLNCLADWDAKHHLRATLARIGTQDPPPTVSNQIYGEGIRCIIDGIKVTGSHSNSIKQQIHKAEVRQELDTKGVLPAAVFPLVNWDAIGQSLEARSPVFRAWTTKHVTGHCAVGYRMKDWGYWESDACPCCGQADERTTHFPYCQNAYMAEQYELALKTKFDEWLIASDTDPSIANFFMSALLSKAIPTPTSDFDNIMVPEIAQEAQEQLLIGFDNMLFWSNRNIMDEEAGATL
jgi:hypothetical protein